MSFYTSGCILELHTYLRRTVHAVPGIAPSRVVRCFYGLLPGECLLATHSASHTCVFFSCVRWQVETQKVVGSESGSAPMPDDALSDRIALLFQEADTDRNGTLSRAEFQAVRAWHITCGVLV